MKSTLRAFFALIISFVIISISTTVTSAQTPTTYPINSSETVTQPFQSNYPAQLMPNVNPDVPLNLNTFIQSSFIELNTMLMCQLVGKDTVNPERKCLGIDQKTGKIGYVENSGGLVGAMSSYISSSYAIPVSSTEYINYLASDFGFIKKSHAQGAFGTTGFDGLRPVAKVWQAFRDIVYLLFIIIFIIIGLGIMFRIQIDPRTVMTIQNQIPKIIMGLILVTLSYAIAGFLIDIMWIFIYMIFNLFAKANNNTDTMNNMLSHMNDTPFGFLSSTQPYQLGLFNIIATSARMVQGVIDSLVTSAVPLIGWVTPFCQTLTGLPLIGGGFAVPCAPWLGPGFFGGIIAGIIITVALVWALFRLWFQLIKTYVFILMDVIFAPFFIMIGLFPGSQWGFGTWFRDIIANISVYPTTVVMFLIGHTIVSQIRLGTPNPFQPPLIGNLPTSGAAEDFAGLIALGIILMTPEVVNMVREALKAPNLKYTAAIGRAISQGADVAGAGPGYAWNRLTREQYAGRPAGAWRSGAYGMFAKLEKGRFSWLGKAGTSALGDYESKGK